MNNNHNERMCLQPIWFDLDLRDSDSRDKSGDDNDEPEESLKEVEGGTEESDDDAKYESKVKHMRTVLTRWFQVLKENTWHRFWQSTGIRQRSQRNNRLRLRRNLFDHNIGVENLAVIKFVPLWAGWRTTLEYTSGKHPLPFIEKWSSLRAKTYWVAFRSQNCTCLVTSPLISHISSRNNVLYK